ncbi:DUF1349 domain-containing protein [Paenibacillus sp. MMS20-IR301]|uniref:DUF1349 domain-containing protein n=1 Tax=Paenibacillus sp. MMS20-IR301 TaxID=2895946 RepID=UPI0028EBCFFC|nr:DUF1349 domain-containing protein [Paenibacillus sp. MMS20-IR301]WNS44927.1 DUF1349 domain-containing protein [Paenibacillus sp. MMS20-IR301]
MRIVEWQAGHWSNEPVSSRIVSGTLVVEAAAGSDYWQQTLYGFQHNNGHALLAPWEDTEAVEISFSLDGFTELYDQAGIMLWHSEHIWIKAGIELNDGVPHIGAVVTDTYSDWSLSPVPEWAGEEVTLRASRMKDAVILRARTDNHPWRTIRVARFPYELGKQAGPFLCAPTRSGFQVSFKRWSLSDPDSDVHTDPQVL